MDIIDLLIGVITSPQATFKEISQKKPIIWAILINLIIIPLNSLVSFHTTPETYHGGSQSIVAAMSIFFTFIVLFLTPLLYLLVAKLFGGQWNYWGLFSAIGFANIINLFIVFFALLAVLLENQIFIYLFTVISFFWLSVLYIFAIRENAEISTGKAVATYILSYIALIVGLVAIIAIPAFLIFMFI